jgi:ligand-binding sensor domain-containing protein
LEHLGVSDGLPSNTIFRIAQDDRGFLWLATDRGLARFDGFQFKTFHHDGLKSNQIIQLYADGHPPTLVNMLGQVAQFDASCDCLTLLDLSREHASNWIRDLQIDHRGDFWLARFSREGHPVQLSWQSADGLKYRDLLAPRSNYPLSTLWDHAHQQLAVIVGANEWPGDIELMRVTHLPEHDSFAIQLNHLHRCDDIPSGYAFIRAMGEQLYLIIDDYMVYRVGGESVTRLHLQIENPKAKYLSMAQDHDGRLWVATSAGAYRLVPLNDSTFASDLHLLPECQVNTLHSDEEGNLWFGTASEGLYVLTYDRYRQVTATNIGKSHFPIAQLTPLSNGKLIGVTRQGAMLIFDTAGWSLTPMLPPSVYNGVSVGPADEILVLGNGTSPNWSFSYQEGQGFSPPVATPAVNGKSATWIDGQWWIGMGRGAIKFDPLSKDTASLATFFTNRVLAIHADRQAPWVWLGLDQGLAKADLAGNLTPYQDREGQSLPYFVESIAQAADGPLFVGTQSHGLWCVQNDRLINLTEAYDLSAQSYQDLLYLPPYLWAITERGVLKINTQDSSYQRIGKNLSTSLHQVFDLSYADGRIWLSTPTDLVSLHTDQPTPVSTPPRIHLLSLEARDREGHIHPSASTFPHTFNQLSIRFAGISFSGHLEYAYRFAKDTQWKRIDQALLQFSELPPQTYHLLIRAEHSNGMYSADPLQVSFTIQPPYWQTAWFIGLGVSVLGLLGWWLVQRIIRRRIQKVEQTVAIQRDMSALKLQALRAQMNPHFIFNCLTSVQQLLLTNHPQKAIDHLGDFAQLIRITFEHSTQDFVPLQLEVSFLQTYIRLELARLTHPVKIEFQVSPSLSPDQVHVPSMLIQPIVENAFQHGLLHRQTGGELSISIEPLPGRSGFLRCTVTDNGVGRARAHAITQKWKKPSGLSSSLNIVKQRLKLFNDQAHAAGEMHIIDLQNEQQQPTGTQVQLVIPYSTL